MRRLALSIMLVSAAVPAAAAGISIAKSAAVVSDGVNLLNPRILPGGTIEYTLVATNPALNPSTITNVTVCDDVPATMTLLTADLNAGAGPVAFAQGLLASGLSYSYVSLASASDGLALYDSTGAVIATPTAGSDTRVRKLCVTLTGTRMLAGGSVQIRYRASVR